MLSRLLLILAGLFIGLWLRGATGAIAEIGLPVLALFALVLAVATAPRSTAGDNRVRAEDAFRELLDAIYLARMAAPAERAAAAAALQSATHRVMISANDRIVRAVQRAAADGYSPAAVAQLVIDMRRSVGRASVTLRPAELEHLLQPGSAKGAGEAGAAAQHTRPASLLG